MSRKDPASSSCVWAGSVSAASGEAVSRLQRSAGFGSRGCQLVAEEENPQLTSRRDFSFAWDDGESVSASHGVKHGRALVSGKTRGVSRIGLI